MSERAGGVGETGAGVGGSSIPPVPVQDDEVPQPEQQKVDVRSMSMFELRCLRTEVESALRDRQRDEAYAEVDKLRRVIDDAGGAAAEITRIRDILNMHGVTDFDGTETARTGGSEYARVCYLVSDDEEKQQMLKERWIAKGPKMPEAGYILTDLENDPVEQGSTP